jgi:4-amino-4-deoxy-L-arabinose transferase-like glycosyltransferase
MVGRERAVEGRQADLVALASLAAVGLVLRAAVLSRAPVFITNDSLSYLLPGFDLATGQGFDPIFKRPPGYPAFVALAVWFFGQQSLLGLLLLQHLLGLLTAGLTYALGRLLFGRVAGWIAGLLTAISGPLLITEHYLMSETLFGFLLVAMLLSFTLGLRSGGLGWVALAGLLLGLAALTRPLAQLLVPLLGLSLLLSWRSWRRALAGTALLAGCYLLIVVPWMARNAVEQGSFTVAGGLGEGLAVRTIRLDQQFDFRDPSGSERLRAERRIYRQEAEEGSAFELAQRLRTEADLTPAEADQAMREIALGAIVQKPAYYLRGSIEMFGSMLVGRPVRLRQDWQPWRGIAWEERAQHLLPSVEPEQDRQMNQVQAVVTLYDPARWWPLLMLLGLVGVGAAASGSAVGEAEAGRGKGATRPEVARRVSGVLPAVVALSLLLVSAFLVGIEWRYRYPLDPLINVMVGGGVAWGLAVISYRLSAFSQGGLAQSLRRAQPVERARHAVPLPGPSPRRDTADSG